MTLLAERWVFTLATNALDADDEPVPARAPYPTPLFYAVAEPGKVSPFPTLLFISNPSSRHGRHIGAGPVAAAGGVYLETEQAGQLRGAQLTGEVLPVATIGAQAERVAAELYLARHPVAAPALDSKSPHRLYAFAIRWAKLTDNRVGMGVHPQWSFASPETWHEGAGEHDG